MAQLHDTIVSGSLRATDTIYSTTNQFQILKIPTASGGTTYGAGTDGQVLKSNGTSVYWATDNNTTYSSLSEASDGTAVSLVTTGEKYTWNRKLSLSGGTMTGALTLAAAPTANMHAATKKYVDEAVAGGGQALENYVLKAGDTMTGALKAKGLRTYVSDTSGNASLNFGETADSTRLGRITMNTTTNIMEFDEGNERYLLPAPTTSSETSYNIVTTNGSYTLSDTLFSPKVTLFDDSYPSIAFATATNPTTDLGSLNYNVSSQRIFFNCYTGSGGAEMFQLPTTTHTDSSWNAYDILTTKDKAIQDIWTIRGVNTTSPTLYFSRTSNDDRFATIYGLTNSSGTTSQFLLRNLHSDGTYTDFYLPEVDRSNTTVVSYDIITSKSPVTVAQGGTGATTAADALTNLGALPLAGGTMTGQIVLSGTGFKTNNAAGYSVNAYGNFTHTDTSTTSSWNICKNSGAGVFTVYYENGKTTVGGTLTVKSTIQTSGDITIQGPTYPSFTLKKANGTALGSFYASANSGRVNIRTWNTAGTYYVDYGLPDDSDNDASRARYFLTTKDFDFVNYTGTSGTMPGLVKSGDGIWLVSVYDSSDATKYWVGIAVKKTSTNPVVQLLKNATITCSGGNTLGTMIFSGGSNYVAKALKIA